MHQHLAEVFSRLDESGDDLRAAVAAIPAALRAQRPAANRWSALDVLEHLALVETRFGGLLAPCIDEALARGLEPETSPRQALPADMAERLVDRTEKRTAPDTALPSGTVDEAAAWAAVDVARSALRDAALRGDGLALGGVRCSHPRFGELSIYQWVELIAAHARRHVAQIDELRTDLVRT